MTGKLSFSLLLLALCTSLQAQDTTNLTLTVAQGA